MASDTPSLVAKEDEGPVLLREISVPARFFRRTSTGCRETDLLFGGDRNPGIMPGSCVMVTGEPGAGKTTFMLQLADALSQAGNNVFYNANEENRKMIKIAADRLNVRGDFLIDNEPSVGDVVEGALAGEFDFVFQDSLQTLEDDQLTGNRLLKSVCRKLVRLSKDHGITVVMIGQITKAGSAAGPMALVHEVDVHVHLGIDRETGERVMEARKNRFGPAYVPFSYSLDEGGVRLLGQAADVPDVVAEVREEIREELLGGGKVSDGCHDRLGPLVSPGFWKTQLRVVVEEMRVAGYLFIEEDIGDRTFVKLARSEA